MDVRFHCAKRVRHSGKKSKHRILENCPTVVQVLRLNPHYGVPIPRFHDLRKMRVAAPGLTVGKRGGYRLIYQAKEMDEAVHIVFVELYFKGDTADLSSAEYKTLESEAEDILADPHSYEWADEEGEG